MKLGSALGKLLPLWLFCAVSPVILATEVVRNVPGDALGYAVVNNLADADAKTQQLLKSLQIELPSPIILLQAATGLAEGINRNGDMLFVVLPPTTDGGSLQFAVWLPVDDYERLLRRLDAPAGQEITAVTIAEEDVLIARHGEWALLMDPEQRERMEQVLAAQPAPPADNETWNAWIAEQDVAAVILPHGARMLLKWSADVEKARLPQPEASNGDDIFGFGEATGEGDPLVFEEQAADGNNISQWQAAIAKWISTSPRLATLVLQAKAIGCGARLDNSGNAIANIRVLGSVEAEEAVADVVTDEPPASLYRGNGFVAYGAGRIPRPLVSIATDLFLRSVIEQLRTGERMVLPDATVAQFQETVQQAVTGVESLMVLTHAGEREEPVYTNEFVVVRTASAAKFTEQAREVLRLWNSMNRDAEGSTRLVFDVQDMKIGQRTATQYLLDIAAADGAPELPEIRQAMEKLFGAGGKLRLWIVPVDDATMLLARATPEQVEAALKTLDEKRPVDWNQPELAAATVLLPDDADWRLFFSPHHYNRWYRRQMDVITGPVIGGPLVKDFPAAPPVGIAGGVRDRELWIDLAVPADVIRNVGTYLKK